MTKQVAALVLSVGSTSATPALAAHKPSQPTEPAATTAPTDPGAPAPKRAERGPFSLLSFHKRNYILTGFTKDSQLKFLLSIKYNLWPNETEHAVYAGYTQLSLWKVFEDSAPFSEINFNPALFYEYRAQQPVRSDGWYCGLLLARLMIEHSSNGMAGRESRSLNIVSGTAGIGCYGERNELLEMKLQAWPDFLFDSENEDAEDYLGYGELTVQGMTPNTGDWWGRFDIGARMRKGASPQFTHGAFILEGSWHPDYSAVAGEPWRLAPYLFVQFFTGYAESLSTYNIPQTHLRIGVGLWDESRTWR